MTHDPAPPAAGYAPPPADSAEATLVHAAQLDPEAFGTLYKLYLDRVYRFLLAHLSSPEEAADLTQQVFLQAFNAICQYQPQGAPFAAWLFRIARNLLIDYERRFGGARSPVSLPYIMQAGLATETDPEGAALQREAAGRLAELLAQLPAEKRQLLTLRFAAQLTAREIATVVGKSEAGVQKQLERVIHDLRRQCVESGDWDQGERL